MRLFNPTNGQVALKLANGDKIFINAGEYSVSLTSNQVIELRSKIALHREAGRLLEEDADGAKILALLQSQNDELDQQDQDRGITDTSYGRRKV